AADGKVQSTRFVYNANGDLIQTVSGDEAAIDIPVTLPVLNHAYGEFKLALANQLMLDAVAGQRLTYTATLADGSALPAWLHINAATGELSGIPTDPIVGVLALKVSATGTSDVAASAVINLPLDMHSLPPVLTQQLANRAALAGQAFQLNLPADLFKAGVAGHTLRYTASLADGSALPSWLHLNAATGELSGVAGNGDVGTLSIKLSAAESGGLATSVMFTLQVNAGYQTPVAGNANASVSAPAGQAFKLAIPAGLFNSPVAGNVLRYQVVQADGSALPGWLSFNALDNTFSGVPPAGAIGSLSLRITAVEMSGLHASTTLSLQVTANATRAGWVEVIKTVSGPGTAKTEVDRFDPVTGGIVEMEVWDPATGKMKELHQWDAVTGGKLLLQKFDVSNGRLIEQHITDGHSGQEIEYSKFDVATGHKIEVHRWDALNGVKLSLDLFDANSGMLVEQNTWDRIGQGHTSSIHWNGTTGLLEEVNRWDGVTGGKTAYQSFDAATGVALQLFETDPATGAATRMTKWDAQSGKVVEYLQYHQSGDIELYQHYDAVTGRLLEMGTRDGLRGVTLTSTQWDPVTGKQVEMSTWDPVTGGKTQLLKFDATTGGIRELIRWDIGGAQLEYSSWDNVT
ncbi:putative Ig domain-containing protein, partial [Herbaspirillum autotrophicum]|uniref:putative Ig domain-containing protein n=1 Tax=Herbaspirillum autotrophicum TaxID=180195 RepID=UPI000A3F25D6